MKTLWSDNKSHDPSMMNTTYKSARLAHTSSRFIYFRDQNVQKDQKVSALVSQTREGGRGEKSRLASLIAKFVRAEKIRTTRILVGSACMSNPTRLHER